MEPGLKLYEYAVELRAWITDLTGSRRVAVWLLRTPIRLAALVDFVLVAFLAIFRLGLIRTATILQVVLLARRCSCTASSRLITLVTGTLDLFLAAFICSDPLDDAAKALRAAAQAVELALETSQAANHALSTFLNDHDLHHISNALADPLHALAHVEVEFLNLRDWSTKDDAGGAIGRNFEYLRSETLAESSDFASTPGEQLKWLLDAMLIGHVCKHIDEQRTIDIEHLARELLPGPDSLWALQIASVLFFAAMLFPGKGHRTCLSPLGLKLVLTYNTVSGCHNLTVSNVKAADAWIDELLDRAEHLASEACQAFPSGQVGALYTTFFAVVRADFEVARSEERLHDTILDAVLLRNEIKRDKTCGRGSV
ncbi:hypothetical protein JCM10449v2_003310 [Rhodotorula kratochvilovae]